MAAALAGCCCAKVSAAATISPRKAILATTKPWPGLSSVLGGGGDMCARKCVAWCSRPRRGG